MTKFASERVSLTWPSLFVASVLVALVPAGCGSSAPALSRDGGGTGSAGVGATTGAGGHNQSGGGATGTAGNGTTTGAAGTTYTGPTVGVDGGTTKIPIGMTQCSDGIDNDHDGLIDSADPECTGPNDNDESTFATGIPGDNKDACKQDCFFDGNSGMGDDGCQWQLNCDPKSTNNKCPFSQSFVDKHMAECSTTASQSQRCIDNCRKYVPNGCDCFGCCVIPGAPTPIRLDPTCTAKDFGDATKCSPCTQVEQCSNPCDRCEICVGKPTVPEDCGNSTVPPGDGGTSTDATAPPPRDGGGGVATCSGGVSCVPGPTASCPAGYGCVTGCCLAIVQ